MQTLRLGKQFFHKDIPLLIAGISLFSFAGYIHQKYSKPPITISKQSDAINVNRNVLLLVNAGNKRLIADLLWIQTLLESDEEHYSKKDLNSWMYLRFSNIATLDPLFYENYLWGGLYLSIVKDDLYGSAEIYEKGLNHYPDDYKLNYYAGFNYYFEMDENEKGIKKLEKIQFYPAAPPSIKFLVQKIKFEKTLDFQDTLLFLKNNYNETSDPILRDKIVADIYSLQAEMDLKCLNANGEGCNTVDFNGKPYLKKDLVWVSQKKFTPYRIYRRKDQATKSSQYQ